MTPAETAVRVIVDLLVRGEYKAVEAVTKGIRLSAGEIGAAVTEYGRRLVPPGAGWWPMVNMTRIQDQPGVFHAAVPMWTAEEGRSDLTLELRLREGPEGVFTAEVLDIHVL